MSINNPIQDVIDRIKSDLEKLEQEVAPTRPDLADPNTKQQKAKELDAFFVDRINLFKDADLGVGLPENNDWEYPVLERRKIALMHLFAEAQERFGDKYPELDIADQLMRINGPLATLSFQTLDQDTTRSLPWRSGCWITSKPTMCMRKRSDTSPPPAGRSTASISPIFPTRSIMMTS